MRAFLLSLLELFIIVGGTLGVVAWLAAHLGA